MLLPNDMDVPSADNTCTHIRLLYGNGRIPHLNQTLVGEVYLSNLGREQFNWRWAANALKDAE